MTKRDPVVCTRAAERHRIAVSVVLLALGATSVVAQALDCPAVIVGTNDAATDVLNVQQAVDTCAKVVLEGRFNFASESTGFPLRVVTVHRSVNIVGQPDDQGRGPRIVGGRTPLLVDAPNAVVRIDGLRFVRPVAQAIRILTARKAVVANCVIVDIEPVIVGDMVVAFGISAGGSFESPISRLEVVDNRIALSGEPAQVGIILTPDDKSMIGSSAIDRNEIRAVAHGIDVRSPGGNAQIRHNRITINDSDRTGDAPVQYVDGIKCRDAGACSIVGNWIESHHPNSSGVRLQSTAGAIVEYNSILMTPPDGLAPGDQSSGVQLVEDSKRSLVGHNQVSGAARTAISVSGTDNVLVLNPHPEFASSVADIEINDGALRTVVVGENGSISDLGAGSVVR